MNAIKIKTTEAIYWHVKRPLGKLGMWFIWAMPRRVVYWAFIRVATANYDGNPGDRTVMLGGFLIDVKRALLDGPATGHDDRDVLAEIIQYAGEYVPGSHAEDYVNPEKAADAIIAAGFRRTPETVTTVDGLDALPAGSFVMEYDGFRVVFKTDSGKWKMVVAWESNPRPSTDLETPVTVLYRPVAQEGGKSNVSSD